MPSIAELGLNVGDRVKFSAKPHTPRDRSLTLKEYADFRHNAEEITVEGTIVALDDNGVCVHPFVEALAAFRRVQNTETDEIYPARVSSLIDGQLFFDQLKGNERFVLSLNAKWNGFWPIEHSDL